MQAEVGSTGLLSTRAGGGEQQVSAETQMRANSLLVSLRLSKPKAKPQVAQICGALLAAMANPLQASGVL